MITTRRDGLPGFTCFHLVVMLALVAPLTGCQLPWSDADRILGTTACRDLHDSYRGTLESCPAWSPDGNEIVAFAARNPRDEFAPGPYLVNLRTGAWRQLARGSGWRYPQAAHWHRNARTVLIDYGGRAEILDINEGVSTRLDDGSGQYIELARWSPSGDSVWYVRTDGLFVMPAGGGAPRRAIPWSAEFSPLGGGWSFSPDGRTIAYAHWTTEANGVGRNRRELRLIDPDGRNIRQLTHLAGNARNPLWIHGGREILFDWADTLCVNRVETPERRWIAVDVATGRVRELGRHLGSPLYQFSYPIAVDFAGERAAVVGNSGSRAPNVGPGVLFTTLIELDTRERLLRPGSPEMH